MGDKIELPEYYRRTYERWYRWFSRVYDPFLRVMGFMITGGFDGERRLREQAVRWVDPKPGEKILDLCSGTGTFALMVADRLSGRGEVVGIEISPDQLRVANKKKKPIVVSFIQGDAQAIQFADSYFDKGFIFGALHEMPGEVRRKVLSEAYRVIRPGGRMVFFEQNEPSQRWRVVWNDFWERFNPEYRTYKDLMRSGLTNEVKEAGFNVLKREILMHESAQVVLAEKEA